MPRKLNMEVGDVFGDLKVLRLWRLPEASSQTRCDAECLRCGSVKSYYASNLISGKTTSCGCKAVGKITKPCVICGKLFDSYRSDNRVTCSDACRRRRAAKSSHDKPRKWGEEAKRRRAEDADIKAQMDVLQPRGVQAALAIPEGQRGPQNRESKIWVLVDPSGTQVPCTNLLDWARNNYRLFEPQTPENECDKAAQRISSGFRAIANSMRGTPSCKRSVYHYKGWGLLSLPITPAHRRKPNDPDQ